MEEKKIEAKNVEEEILEKVRQMLAEQGITGSEKPDPEQLVFEYLLPALDELKEIQSALYEPFSSAESGMVRKVKNGLIRKMANVTRNTVELSLMRQQKFNDNVSLIIRYLLEENKRLKEQLGKSK
jgi:hypothetical protein